MWARLNLRCGAFNLFTIHLWDWRSSEHRLLKNYKADGTCLKKPSFVVSLVGSGFGKWSLCKETTSGWTLWTAALNKRWKSNELDSMSLT